MAIKDLTARLNMSVEEINRLSLKKEHGCPPEKEGHSSKEKRIKEKEENKQRIREKNWRIEYIKSLYKKYKSVPIEECCLKAFSEIINDNDIENYLSSQTETKINFILHLYSKHRGNLTSTALTSEFAKEMKLNETQAQTFFSNLKDNDDKNVLVSNLKTMLKQDNPKVIKDFLLNSILFKKLNEKESRELNPKPQTWLNPIVANNIINGLFGGRNTGQTALLLNITFDLVNEGKRVAFLPSSRTTRKNRVDQCLKERGVNSSVPDNFLITDDIIKILSQADTLDLIAIDDIHEHPQLSNNLSLLQKFANLFQVKILFSGGQRTHAKSSSVCIHLEKTHSGKTILSLETSLPRPKEYADRYKLKEDYTLGKGITELEYKKMKDPACKYEHQVSHEKIETVRSILQSHGRKILTAKLFEEAKKQGVSNSQVKKARLVLSCIYTVSSGRSVTVLPVSAFSSESNTQVKEGEIATDSKLL